MEKFHGVYSFLHQVYEKEKKCETNICAEPRLRAEILHIDNFKQNVGKDLAILKPSTIAADKMYFPDCKHAAGSLHLVHVWWTISHSNVRFQCYDRNVNATVLNDGKPKFLRTFADWLDSWQHQKISNCGKFTLSLQFNAEL